MAEIRTLVPYRYDHRVSNARPWASRAPFLMDFCVCKVSGGGCWDRTSAPGDRPSLSVFKAGALPLCQTSSCVCPPRAIGMARHSSGARGWDRTIDARAFNAALYRLSYSGETGGACWIRTSGPTHVNRGLASRCLGPLGQCSWNWCPQRCSRTRPAAYKAAALPLSYGGKNTCKIRLCPCAKGAHCCAPDRFAAHRGRPGAHDAFARPRARSKAVVQRHTRIEQDSRRATRVCLCLCCKAPRRPVPAGALRRLVKDLAHQLRSAAARWPLWAFDSPEKQKARNPWGFPGLLCAVRAELSRRNPLPKTCCRTQNCHTTNSLVLTRQCHGSPVTGSMWWR